MLLGHTTVCAVEIEPYCQKVLFQRQRDGILPRFPIWDDVRTFDGNPWRGAVDVVCAGFPCQDISSSGRGKGISGPKSKLWKEVARVVGEASPTFVFIENSPFLKSRGLEVVLEDLAELGYDAAWGVIGAHQMGAPHKRERIWVLAHSQSCGRVREEKVSQFQGRAEFKRTGKAIPLWRSPVNAATGERFDVEGSCGWDAEPNVDRVVDGLAYRVDRLKAIGNGQVPIVAATAWEVMNEPHRG